ncbi:MAG: META domain-containing protein [Actinomycetota bacterium]|nr:META domain-containing protein [Actinomycetota bacterium]
MRRVRFAVLAMLCAVAFTACAPLFPGQAEGPFNGDWMLMQAGWRDARFVVEGTGITLVSDGETVSGFSGCHEYAFRLNGDAEEFSFGEALDPGRSGPASGSFGACSGSLERVEARYLGVLLAADGAEVRDDELVVTAGHSYLIFAPIPLFPGRRLVGTEWVLEAYGETWRDEWATEMIGMPTLRFVGQDRIVGTLGCGGIVATYRVVRTEIFVLSLHRYGAEGCLSAFSEQDQLLAQFLDGFRAYLLGDTHLVLTHERLQLMYRAAEG